MTPVSESQNYTRISATTTIRSSDCAILGIFVASASATPTIAVGDQLATGTATPVIGAFTPAPATFYPMPIRLTVGLTVTISGTVDCTVIWTDG